MPRSIGSAFFLTLIVTSSLWAEDFNWVGASGPRWTNSASWQGNAVPTRGDRAYFRQGPWDTILVDEIVAITAIDSWGFDFVRDEANDKGVIVLDTGQSNHMAKVSSSHFRLPIELQSDAQAALSTFSDSIILNSNELLVNLSNFDDVQFQGPGRVVLQHGVAHVSGTSSAAFLSTGGTLNPDSLFQINADADLRVELDLINSQIDQIRGDGGVLHLQSLDLAYDARVLEDLVGRDLELFPGWTSITFGSLNLPRIGEWNSSRLSEGILRLEKFELASCDLDDSGTCDLVDIESIAEAVFAGEYQSSLDLDQDGDVDLIDRDTWLVSAGIANGHRRGYLLGDATLSGRVDAADLMTLAQNWQSSSLGWSNADFNFDGMVNSVDLNLLAQNWQKDVLAQASPLPEPSNYFAVFLGVWFIAYGGRHAIKRRY